MSKEPLGPERAHFLETYVKCLKRAERRIIIGGQLAKGRIVNLNNFHVQRPLIYHIAARIKRDGIVAHGSALMRLQIARSKYQTELDGGKW